MNYSRLNTKLDAHNYPPMTSLVKDLSDGVRLIQLMVCLSTAFSYTVYLNVVIGNNGYVLILVSRGHTELHS